MIENNWNIITIYAKHSFFAKKDNKIRMLANWAKIIWKWNISYTKLTIL